MESEINELLNELEDTRQLALKNDKPAAAISASLAKARLLGLDKARRPIHQPKSKLDELLQM